MQDDTRKSRLLARYAALILACAVTLPLSPGREASAQSGRKLPEKARKQGAPAAPAPDAKKPAQQQAPAEPDAPPITPEDLKDAIQLAALVVDVETVVYEKKSGKILTDLKREHFKVFEDGVEQEVVNFVPTQGPVTMVLLLEFSRRIDNRYFSKAQILQPAYYFVTQFVKPEDNIAIVAFDMRPEVVTDFTNSPKKLQEGILFLNRNNPAFNESNVYDAIKFVVEGGELNGEQYAGLKGVNRRTAIVLVTLGIDTFSKTGYQETLERVGNSGIPFYTINIGKLFHKMNEARMSSEMNLEFLQAENMLKSFANMSGGAYFPITFPGEIPTDMASISNLMRSQYSLGYTPSNTRREGKRRKIVVKVDADGDGTFGDKGYEVQHREVYIEPRDAKTK